MEDKKIMNLSENVKEEVAKKEVSNSAINTLEFTYERLTANPDGSQGEPIKATIKAPFLSLIPVPAFTMDEATVDFNMEVKEMNMADSKTHEDTSSTASYAAQQPPEEGTEKLE